jgi:LacI family transcriptional regulator
MITTKKLGKELGLAQATISMALRDHPEISLATRRRVQDAAKRLNYTPSRIARAMRTGKTHTVGVIVPVLSVSYFPAVVDAVEIEAKRCAYQCLICQSRHTEEEFQHRVGTLLEHRVDGLVVMPFDSFSNAATYRNLQRHGTPFVIADMEMPGDLAVDSVTNDNVAIGRTATEHLLALGHRRIACLRGTDCSLVMIRRFEGYCAAMRDHGVAVDERLVVEHGRHYTDGQSAVMTLLARGVPFTALIAPSDGAAVEAMLALQAHGIRVPADISVVGCANQDFTALVSPALTTVDQNATSLGQSAFALLADRLADPAAPPRAVKVAAALVQRGSTAPAPSNPFLTAAASAGSTAVK